MPKILYASMRKPTSISKSLKSRFGIANLSEAKEVVSRLSGYSDWVHLKRETLKNSNLSNSELHITSVHLESIAAQIERELNLSRRDSRFLVATNFPFLPTSACHLAYYFSEDDLKSYHLLGNPEAVDKDMPDDEVQPYLDIRLEIVQGLWNERPTYEHAALYWQMADVDNCARAQVHLGMMIYTGTLGIKNYKDASELLLKGLPYRSKVMFADSVISPTGKDLYEMQKHIPKSWCMAAKAIREHADYNNFESHMTALDAVRKGFDYANRLVGKADVSEILASLHLVAAELLAELVIVHGWMPEKDDVLSNPIDHLVYASKYGNEFAEGERLRYGSYLNAVESGNGFSPEMNSERVMLYIVSEMVGSHVPAAREVVFQTLMRNVKEQTALYRAHPHIYSTAFDLLFRVRKDIQEWSHNKTDFLSLISGNLSYFLEGGEHQDAAVDLCIDLAEEGNPFVLHDALIAAKTHRSETMDVILLGERGVAAIDPRTLNEAGLSQYQKNKEFILDLKIERFASNLEELDDEQIEEQFLGLKEEADYLANEYGFLFPAFKLIYFARSIEQLEEMFIVARLWVESLYRLVLRPDFTPHEHSDVTAVPRIKMEYGCYLTLEGDYINAKEPLEEAAKDYPDAREALSFVKMFT
ncbi:hypothetical protein [Vibrio sp. D431a]|uniref:hypothetical protein n=1 Tax=Vibrio sp. D431a TaxID=2837388 RepID=UPI00255798AC|nr:hypothetical protein [Vibrio sp. D431a]MDK9789846.1 hypothetical protein [Vibrio sp. D431a]